jgi:glycerol uptake facilitator-like aquaporin
MEKWVAEIVGTAILILLGDGVVANVVLGKTKGQASGWIVITTGWAMAVAVAVYAVGRISGAHINPAVTIGLASIGDMPLERRAALHRRSVHRCLHWSGARLAGLPASLGRDRPTRISSALCSAQPRTSATTR